MSLIVKIKKDFGKFVLNADFKAENGITCLLGASGSGKSMTLKCIAGLVTPDSGYIELDGTVFYDSEKKIDLSPQERRVGYLFQNYALFPNMTVWKNLMCAMHQEKNKEEKERRGKEILKLLQLDGLEKRYPGQLSGGQAQRVALARILVNQPRLLMLDEAFSALDYHLKDKIIPDIKEILKGFPHGVLMVTHSREEAYRMADQAAVIRNGELLTMKPIKKLFADPETIEAALITGCKNIAAVEKTGEQQVYVPEWGITLNTGKKVPEDIAAIGIRAHYFHENSPQNLEDIQYVGELEEPFEWILQFRYKNQKENTGAVWWRMSKEKRPLRFPERIGVSPANIMLLRK